MGGAIGAASIVADHFAALGNFGAGAAGAFGAFSLPWLGRRRGGRRGGRSRNRNLDRGGLLIEGRATKRDLGGAAGEHEREHNSGAEPTRYGGAREMHTL